MIESARFAALIAQAGVNEMDELEPTVLFSLAPEPPGKNGRLGRAI